MIFSTFLFFLFGKFYYASRKYPEIFVNSGVIYTLYVTTIIIQILVLIWSNLWCYYDITGFYINNNCSYVKRKWVNISLDKNIESIVLNIDANLPKIKNFISGCIYKYPNIPIPDFNLKYLVPLLEKLNRQNNLFFLMGTLTLL